MKTFVTVALLLILASGLRAATIYTVSSNTSWNGVYPSGCNTCTFNLSPGVTLTLNANSSCVSCTINGGTVTMTSDFTFQQSAFNNTTINLTGHKLNLQNNGTSFTNTIVNATGASTFLPTGSLSINASVFNFSGTSELHNNGGTLNINSSNLYFYGNSFFNATAGPVNLNTSSQLVAGDGSAGSKAYLLMNGPVLNLVDAGSALYLGNLNNYYANWGSYNSLSNSTSYSILNNHQNCGGTGQNACQQQFYYGCGSLNKLGPTTCSTLATSFNDFKALQMEEAIKLSWAVSDISQNIHFVVERSNQFNSFTVLTTMEADGRDGFYSFTDFAPEPGTNNYRITMINPDGKTNYSKIVSVQNSDLNEISVYPNPVMDGHIFIRTPTADPVTLSVYSMDGRLLSMHVLNGQVKYSIDLPPSRTRQNLIIHIVTSKKSCNFNLLKMP